VAVFDAASRASLSLNRAARRTVAGLETPNGSAERLREAVVYRRGSKPPAALQCEVSSTAGASLVPAAASGWGRTGAA